MSATLLPLVAQVSPSNFKLTVGGQNSLTVLVTADGTPLSNASVKWIIVAGGNISNGLSYTDSSGVATAVYNAGSLKGTFLIESQVSKPGYVIALASTNAKISPLPGSGGLEFLNIPLLTWTVVIVVLGAVVIAVVVIRIRRTRGGLSSSNKSNQGKEEPKNDIKESSTT